jgi:nucleoporin NUP82
LFQTLHTPNLQFEIRQISLNPSGKLLAVAGIHQIAVVVLPRVGYSRLVPEVIDCKYAPPLLFKLFLTIQLFRCVQIGQFYHAANTSAAIAKIDWHPWGEAGSTLLVMTVDGKLRFVQIYLYNHILSWHIREYDISADPEEPQQVLSFVPEKKPKAFMAEDESEREVASFTLGKGRADWGPLTVYAITRSGDIYSICPYMPQNAYVYI